MPSGRHEAPWGARNLYTGGGAGTSITGPGMKIVKRRKFQDAPRANMGSVGVEAERAALAGMTLEQYRATERAHHQSKSTTAARPALRSSETRSSVEELESTSGWFYVDRNGDVQGPFGSVRMKEWADTGALTSEVKVRPWHAQEFKQLSHYRTDGGPLSSPPAGGVQNIGHGAHGAGTWVWIKQTEGLPPNVRQVWWNTLTDEKMPVKPVAPPVPLATQSQHMKAATTGLEGLSGYESSGSDSD